MLKVNNTFGVVRSSIQAPADKNISASQRLEIMRKSWSRYKKVFIEMERMTKVPRSILFAFACQEDGGNMAMGKPSTFLNWKGEPSNFLGVMQIAYKYADNTILTNEPDYSQEERRFCSEKFGTLGAIILRKNPAEIKALKEKIAQPNAPELLTKSEVYDFVANVFIGAQTIISLSKIDGVLIGNEWNLSRLVVGYNAGSGKLKTTGAYKQTTENILKNPTIKTETKNYIKSVIGKGGWLDLWKIHFKGE